VPTSNISLPFNKPDTDWWRSGEFNACFGPVFFLMSLFKRGRPNSPWATVSAEGTPFCLPCSRFLHTFTIILVHIMAIRAVSS